MNSFDLLNFATRYNELKKEGKIPTKILEVMVTELGISKTSYYTRLRTARGQGLITDSFKSVTEEKLKRQKCECAKIDSADVEEELKETTIKSIQSEIEPEEVKPQIKELPKVAEEKPKTKSTFWTKLKNIMGGSR